MTTTTQQLAKHLREVHYGGNWTWVNLKDTLDGITWHQALKQVHGLNTIAVLVNHIGYYVTAQISVLQGGELTSKDSESFIHPPIQSQHDWDTLVAKSMREAETLAALIEQMPDTKLWDTFTNEKYGSYFRNLLGNIEHIHYHLGQIAIIKKIVQAQAA